MSANATVPITPTYWLYRYEHPDGTAKEWAYAPLSNGQAVIRWGRQGALVQSQLNRLAVAEQRAQEKTRKGYVFVGHGALGADVGATAMPQAIILGAHPVALPGDPPMAQAPAQAPPPRRQTQTEVAALIGGADGDDFSF